MSNAAQQSDNSQPEVQSCFSRIANPAEDSAQVAAMLRLAEGLPELRLETRLWQAMQALKAGRAWEAWAYLVSRETGVALNSGRIPELPRLLAAAAQAQGEDSVARHLLELYPDTSQTTISQAQSAHEHKNSSAAPVHPAKANSKSSKIVDIIIPVFRGREQTLECIHSALASQALLKSKTEIVVINDASPEADLVADLRELARQQKITLIEQPQNLGFIRTMNRAMALHPQRDVVWLNADTRVVGNWLDRLVKVAQTDVSIAAVSPFTNHGELMSFPNMMRRGGMPDAAAQQQLDQLAMQAWNGAAPDLAAVCGFCLYLRRAALDQVGLLDDIHLLAGYGEDSDWSQRALQQGWRLVAAPNVFVAHHGSVSFGIKKRQLVTRNNAIIKKRYPRAEQDGQAYQQRDPLAEHRQRLQQQRLLALTSPAKAGQGATNDPHNNEPQPLAVDKELLVLGPASWNHPALPHSRLDPYAADGSRAEPEPVDQYAWLRWRPLADSRHPQACKIVLSLPPAGQSLPICLEYRLPQDLAKLEQDLRGLPDLVWAFHEIKRLPVALLQLCQRLQCRLRLYPLDGGLLQAAADPGSAHARLLLQLAHQAEAVVLPYRSLLEVYRAALPPATIEYQSWARMPDHQAVHRPEATNTQQAAPARSVLIADDLDRPQIAQKWLALAQLLNRSQADSESRTHKDASEAAIKLLTLDQYPANRQLRALGNLIEITPIAGVSLPKSLQLCQCTVALSLDSQPAGSWPAPGLATQLGLTLLAPEGLLADEVGADTFNTLPELASRLLNRPVLADPAGKAEVPAEDAANTKAPDNKAPNNKLSTKAPTMTKKRSQTPARQNPWQAATGQKVFLNLGCGTRGSDGLPAMFQGQDWQQVRVDIDPDTAPDIVTSNTDLSMIPDGQVDAVWSSHSLEHLEFHNVPVALKEIQRVLKPDGFALITLPDLNAVAELVVAGRLTDVIYQSAAGPIRAMDMLFGHGDSLAAGKHYMAHRCGFDDKLLAESLLDAGFNEVRVRKGRSWDLWAYAFNSDAPQGVFELEV